ncbi:hypothetical protein BaRGS_00033360 [Batillaria attramentaria]|uniref:Ketoreductase domain-containing protein n=1 Tax=Batillaria attramentaria TaxID=370345 RepID=A0ABD0JL13_9CAEN
MAAEIQFKGKRALVTGAGKGIGRAVAIALHKAGAQTVAISRTQADLDSLKAECPGIQTLAQDISDWSATRQAVSSLGHFDLLVNNAGVHQQIPFLEFPEAEIDRTFNTNYKAAFNVSQVVARGMVERGTGGAIVNVSSDSSIRGFGGEAAYGASKAALELLTRVMAGELGPKKPTLTRTNLIKDTILKDEVQLQRELSRNPLGRIAEVSDITGAVLFLLSDQAAMMNGASLLIDGGATFCS